MEESTLNVQKKTEALNKQTDKNTENVKESNNTKTPITEIIETVLVSDFINCHTCRIKFRKSCMINHFKSDYHKYNMRIFNEFMIRYTNSIIEPIPTSFDVSNLSLNYCNVCNLDLTESNKYDHYVSEIHNLNEDNLETAMRLADAYMSNNNICNRIVYEDIAEAEVKKADVTINKILEFTKEYFINNVGNKTLCRICGLVINAYNEILTHVKVEHEIVLNVDSVLSSIKINKELKIESYKQISIVTVKDTVIVVAADAWQGLSGKICILCNNKEFKNKIHHIQNKTHVHNLFVSSLIDSNGIRELLGSRFNCLVCQKVFSADKYYNHLKSIDHKINYGEGVNKSCYRTIIKNDKYYRCSSCDFNIPDTYKLRHECGPRHFFNIHFMKTIAISKADMENTDRLENIKQLDKKPVVNTMETTTKKTKNKKKATISDLSYTCKTCDCRVPTSAKDEHEAGTRHKKNVQKKTEDSKRHQSKSPENVEQRSSGESKSNNNTRSKYSTKKKKTKPNVPQYLQKWSNILRRKEKYQTDLNTTDDKSYISCPDDEEQVINNVESSLLIEEMDGEVIDKPEYSDMWKSLLQDDVIKQKEEDARSFTSTVIESKNLNINEPGLLEVTKFYELSFLNATIGKSCFKIYIESNLNDFKKLKEAENNDTDAKCLQPVCRLSFSLNGEESGLVDVTNNFCVNMGSNIPTNRSLQIYKSSQNNDNENDIYYCVIKSKNSSLENPKSTSNEASDNSGNYEPNARCELGISQKTSGDNSDKEFLNGLIKEKKYFKYTNTPDVDTPLICEEKTHKNEENSLKEIQSNQTIQNETEKDNINNSERVDNVISDKQNKDQLSNVPDTATESTSFDKINNELSTKQTLEKSLPEDLDPINKSDTQLKQDFLNVALSSTTNSDDDKEHTDDILTNIDATSTFKSDAKDNTNMKFNNNLKSTNTSEELSEDDEELAKTNFADTSGLVYQILSKIYGKGDTLNDNNIKYANELIKYREANNVGAKCKSCNIIVKKSELIAHSKSQQHIQSLNRSLQRNNALSPNSDIITIDVDDKVIDIEFGNYNGLFLTSENKVWCTFCQCHALTVDHVYHERHIETIKKCIITSKDCLRNIDVGFAHCSLCNLIIQTGDNHTQTDSHIANLLKSVRSR